MLKTGVRLAPFCGIQREDLLSNLPQTMIRIQVLRRVDTGDVYPLRSQATPFVQVKRYPTL